MTSIIAPDEWLELERVIDRLARLVLQAQSLADRTASCSVLAGDGEAARADRVRRLRAAVQLGQRAIAAAVRVA